jgi:hypothetical protein
MLWKFAQKIEMQNCIFFFLSGTGLELRAWHFLGRCSTTLAVKIMAVSLDIYYVPTLCKEGLLHAYLIYCHYSSPLDSWDKVTCWYHTVGDLLKFNWVCNWQNNGWHIYFLFSVHSFFSPTPHLLTVNLNCLANGKVNQCPMPLASDLAQEGT